MASNKTGIKWKVLPIKEELDAIQKFKTNPNVYDWLQQNALAG
jgi:hypothetical protein